MVILSQEETQCLPGAFPACHPLQPSVIVASLSLFPREDDGIAHFEKPKPVLVLRLPKAVFSG